MIRAVLFDLDGTLVDNMGFHIDAWLETARALDRPLSAEEVMRDYAGRRNDEIFPRLLGRAVPPDELAELAREKEARYRARYAPHLRPVRGALALLDELDAARLPYAVASAAPRENRAFVLDGLGLHARFSAVVGAEDVPRGKPAPDLFLEAAARLGVAPADALVFEDGRLGVLAAMAAGMRAVGITTAEPARALAEAGALATAPDFAALPPEVRALWSAR